MFYTRPFRQLAGEGDFFNSTQMRSKQFLIRVAQPFGFAGINNTGGAVGATKARATPPLLTTG